MKYSELKAECLKIEYSGELIIGHLKILNVRLCIQAYIKSIDHYSRDRNNKIALNSYLKLLIIYEEFQRLP
jgi:hypothetical protein